MDPNPKLVDSQSNGMAHHHSLFPDEVLEKVLSLIDLHKDRNSVSLVCKVWYNAERWTRSNIFIGNCYSVSPEIVARRFPRIKSVRLRGKPRFSDFNMLPQEWGPNVHSWLVMFADVYPFLEELRLKRMTVRDESLELLAKSFTGFKALSLSNCMGFTDDGLKAIATHCSDNFTSLEILNFVSLYDEVNFDALERLVNRCQSLRVLRVNDSITLDQLQRLLVHAPHLTELGTGSFEKELTTSQYVEIESAFTKSKNLRALSGLWFAEGLHLYFLYGACAGLTFLNLSTSYLQKDELAKLLVHCPNLRRLWITDIVQDKGLEAVGSSCPLLEELRVSQLEAFNIYPRCGVTEQGLLAVSLGCPKLRYVLYYCRRMTNAAIISIVQNCPNFTHFRLCMLKPDQPDCLTNEPMNDAFAAVVKACPNLRRLSFSGLLTDMVFDYIGNYAKNLENLSMTCAGSANRGMQRVLEGCPKLRKLQIQDSHSGEKLCFLGSRGTR
ncbi:hypothetical protein CASFOL_040701 [Castilleja foliolosa]|uniref:F-box domain-containing protein n=1 Tax=Castilleja foliolosa TaxID=1961234 RepID=A0ABD3BDW8_9LAMI